MMCTLVLELYSYQTAVITENLSCTIILKPVMGMKKSGKLY